MHFVVYSNFNSLDLVSSRIKLNGVKTVYEAENRKWPFTFWQNKWSSTHPVAHSDNRPSSGGCCLTGWKNPTKNCLQLSVMPEVIWTKSKRTSVFPHETVPYVIFLVYTLISPMVSNALDVYIHTCWIGFYLSVRWGFAMKVGFSWYTFIYSGELFLSRKITSRAKHTPDHDWS